MGSKIISFSLNGRDIEVLVAPLTTVQSVLRDQLELTATKSGCKQGGCGSCTILVGDVPMLSCLLPVEDVAGMQLTTLEGLTPQEGLNEIQEAFYENFAAQCGFCSPGMIVVASALLARNPNPSRGEIVEALTGNYCRCTGYEPIVIAIQDAAARISSNGAS